MTEEDKKLLDRINEYAERKLNDVTEPWTGWKGAFLYSLFIQAWLGACHDRVNQYLGGCTVSDAECHGNPSQYSRGTAGVAIATVISQTISAFLVVRCLMKEQGAIHLELKELRIEKDKLMRILQIGLPAGFQGIVFSLSNVVIQSAINSFGAIAVAGNSAAANIEGFVYMAMNAFYQATISFTSQNFGAKKKDRINKILFAGQVYVVATGLILGSLAVFFGKELL